MQNNKQFYQFISEPQDINFGGKVHGGAVMNWIDNAGYASACNWSGAYCVTAYVGGIRFIKPIKIGALVRIETQIIYTGTTSMHISVDVYSKGVTKGEFHKTTHCIMVFVAVDEEGKPTPIKRWKPQSEEEKKFESYAIKLMDLRKDIDQEMLPFVYSHPNLDGDG